MEEEKVSERRGKNAEIVDSESQNYPFYIEFYAVGGVALGALILAGFAFIPLP